MPRTVSSSGETNGHIDNFGNLITNITANNLNDFLKDKSPLIILGKYNLFEINNTYSEKNRDSLMALINSSGYLEIAVSMGRASEYLEKSPDEIIGMRVEVTAVN